MVRPTYYFGLVANLTEGRRTLSSARQRVLNSHQSIQISELGATQLCRSHKDVLLSA
jgi:hypothetical protein